MGIFPNSQTNCTCYLLFLRWEMPARAIYNAFLSQDTESILRLSGGHIQVTGRQHEQFKPLPFLKLNYVSGENCPYAISLNLVLNLACSTIFDHKNNSWWGTSGNENCTRRWICGYDDCIVASEMFVAVDYSISYFKINCFHARMYLCAILFSLSVAF
ncbi:hypothetical protein XELAEV_18012767mg [Xenopus laevis]|uniref:Uncharacterized protein n=1 Tax=Xenopus laevis TaxID=8355 RepID=A0A974DN98_XENLA|nr:hypothetical protein XELAEV_18012767mg [Xenopus laevis]